MNRKQIIDNIMNNGIEVKYYPFALTEDELNYIIKRQII